MYVPPSLLPFSCPKVGTDLDFFPGRSLHTIKWEGKEARSQEWGLMVPVEGGETSHQSHLYFLMVVFFLKMSLFQNEAAMN